MEQITRIGMDTSKHIFQLHGVNTAAPLSNLGPFARAGGMGETRRPRSRTFLRSGAHLGEKIDTHAATRGRGAVSRERPRDSTRVADRG
jgi:hypothetical protein